jgi:hypothetical protein
VELGIGRKEVSLLLDDLGRGKAEFRKGLPQPGYLVCPILVRFRGYQKEAAHQRSIRCRLITLCCAIPTAETAAKAPGVDDEVETLVLDWASTPPYTPEDPSLCRLCRVLFGPIEAFLV